MLATLLAATTVCVTTAWGGLSTERLYWKAYNQPYLMSTDKFGQDVQTVRSASWLNPNDCPTGMDPAGNWIIEYPANCEWIRKHDALTGDYADLPTGYLMPIEAVGVDAQYIYKPWMSTNYIFRLSDGAFVGTSTGEDADSYHFAVANDTCWYGNGIDSLFVHPISDLGRRARAQFVGEPTGGRAWRNLCWDGAHYYLMATGDPYSLIRKFDQSWTSFTDYDVDLHGCSVMAVAEGQPDRPMLVSPDSGAEDEPVAGTLAWEAAARATSYDVYLGTDSPPATKVREDQTETSYEYSGLSHNETYYWKVAAKNSYGETSSLVWSFTTTAESGGMSRNPPSLLPSEFALSVSPNPMGLGTAVHYEVPVAANASLKLYDVTGALARTVSSGPAQPGRYTANLSAKGLARGVYILKLDSGTGSLTRKLVIQ